MNTITKLVVLLVFTLVSLNSQSQVTVNTSLAKGTFIIDGQGNNTISNLPAESLDDIIVDVNGNMGIGTNNPTKKLHINTSSGHSFILQDGTQRPGYSRVLTSDENGQGSWQVLGALPIILISLDNTIPFLASEVIGSNYKYTGISMSLPPGIWLIDITIATARDTSVPNTGANDFNERLFSRSILSDSPTSISSTSDIYPGGSTSASGYLYAKNTGKSTLNGFLVINNSSASTKTYYYALGNGINYGVNPNCKFTIGQSKDGSFISATYMDESH